MNYLVKALNLSFFPELWAMRTRMVAPKAGGKANELVVLLPGRFSQPEEFERHGIVDLVREKRPHARVAAPDLHLGYYVDRIPHTCLHEEIAQGLGLVNDSPKARPSIFNDNEEFALLTPQDEMMLRILYDRRLHPGMSMAEARPIVETIAAELLPGES